MGRKVHPIGFRLKINKTWEGRWYAEGEEYVNNLHQDFHLRELVRGEAPKAGVSRDRYRALPWQGESDCSHRQAGYFDWAQRRKCQEDPPEPGSVVGKKIDLEIKEIKSPDLDAYLVAQNIAEQLERRISYQRAMKRAIQQAMRQGGQGIRVEVSGRLSGAEMARTVNMREGRVPRQTLRADIDYRQGRSADHLWSDWRQGVDLQGEVLPEVEEKPESTEGVYVSE